jgi:hypothetical protein
MSKLPRKGRTAIDNFDAEVDAAMGSSAPPVTNVRIGSDEAAKLRQSLPKGADLPGGAKRIICLSPLAKLFSPRVDIEEFLEAPDSVFADTDFDVVIESSWSTKSYRYGETYTVTELEAMYLVGTDNNRFERATGGTGFVYFDIPEDLLAAFNYAKKTGKVVDKEINEELNKYLEKAKALSNKRVVDFIKDKYNMLYQNRQFVESTGGKPMPPNDMEILITFILKAEINKANSKRKALRQQWEAANREISGQV